MNQFFKVARTQGHQQEILEIVLISVSNFLLLKNPHLIVWTLTTLLLAACPTETCGNILNLYKSRPSSFDAETFIFAMQEFKQVTTTIITQIT